MQRLRHADQPRADERGREVEREPRARPLAEDDRRGDDRHDRLHLLQHDGRHEVGALDECLGEEDRRDRRRAGADHDRREDVAPPQAEHGRERAERKRQRDEHEREVLAEDDRRDFCRMRQRRADPGVEAP